MASPAVITSSAISNPGQITCSGGHTFQTGDEVTIAEAERREREILVGL